ncbi:hypothetical protein HII17_05695 [Thalassotalea sp. M1531]|uniref:Uncharacterized protein n=1 Tax=Thalassotalea algicola TaxID=2716224 RepID=A0A7Y0Q664_9GAMM|nr:hypothetical protein [Thalassotalea algicola]NMP31053.1 hypothetical protein [Thalassotalea algicola]
MINRIIIAILVLLFANASYGALGCDSNGIRNQTVYATEGNTQIGSWMPGEEIYKLTLKNEFNLGIKIEAVPSEYYAAKFKEHEYVPELVKITLYDLDSTNPKELTHTYGGANSVQGFSAIGGADKVVELGEAGLTLNLIKHVCVKVGAKNI